MVNFTQFSRKPAQNETKSRMNLLPEARHIWCDDCIDCFSMVILSNEGLTFKPCGYGWRLKEEFGSFNGYLLATSKHHWQTEHRRTADPYHRSEMRNWQNLEYYCRTYVKWVAWLFVSLARSLAASNLYKANFVFGSPSFSGIFDKTAKVKIIITRNYTKIPMASSCFFIFTRHLWKRYRASASGTSCLNNKYYTKIIMRIHLYRVTRYSSIWF